MTAEDLLRERQELLSTTKDSLSDWLPFFDSMAREGTVCVIGHEAALAACQDEHLTIVQI